MPFKQYMLFHSFCFRLIRLCSIPTQHCAVGLVPFSIHTSFLCDEWCQLGPPDRHLRQNRFVGFRKIKQTVSNIFSSFRTILLSQTLNNIKTGDINHYPANRTRICWWHTFVKRMLNVINPHASVGYKRLRRETENYLRVAIIVREQNGLSFNSRHSKGLKTVPNRERPAD